MRLEATVPDNRGNAVDKLAGELGLSRSQLIDEALVLFLKAVIEVRGGRRLVTLDPRSSQPACEIVTPTLAALEWALRPEKLQLSAEALAKMRDLVESSPQPSPRLRAAAIAIESFSFTFTWPIHSPSRLGRRARLKLSSCSFFDSPFNTRSIAMSVF